MTILQSINRALFLCVTLLMMASPVVAQSGAQSADHCSAQIRKKPVTSDSPSDQPWYANTQGAYTVSLGTGQLISLYPPARNDQTIPNGEYVEGQQSLSLKSKDYKYQLFYGVSASSIYTNSIGGVGRRFGTWFPRP